MILRIDTKDQKVVEVQLKDKGKVIAKKSRQNVYGSQVLLPLIVLLIKEAGVKMEALEAVEVETGPGSFTGLRVGVSVANALGYSLNIPVNGKKIETQISY